MRINKIEAYNLGDRVKALSGRGYNTHDIAGIVTKELPVEDTISQPTVSRYLKRIRQERSEQTRTIVQEHIEKTVPEDLNAIEDVEAYLLSRFSGSVDLSQVSDQDLAADIARLIQDDHRARAEYGMKAVRVIELKLKYAGILEDPDKEGDKDSDPVDLDKFRREMEDFKETGSA